jgi:peroxiredoxin
MGQEGVMIKRTVLCFLMVLGVAQASDPEFGSVEIGATAPAFSLTNLAGETVSLADHAGKVVVLEWFNPGCPFVKQAHGGGGALEKMASRWTDKGVVWLAINSGAPGKQGAGVEANISAKKEWSMEHAVLLDADGTVGRLYAAKTTPQMIVIDTQGRQVYNGAVDNAPFGKTKGEALSPITENVLTAVTQGQPSPHSRSKPYGCSVKYGG